MNLLDLMKATNAAKSRTGRLIGTRVKQGLFQVVDVEYNSKGRSKVVELTCYLPMPSVIAELNGL